MSTNPVFAMGSNAFKVSGGWGLEAQTRQLQVQSIQIHQVFIAHHFCCLSFFILHPTGAYLCTTDGHIGTASFLVRVKDYLIFVVA